MWHQQQQHCQQPGGQWQQQQWQPQLPQHPLPPQLLQQPPPSPMPQLPQQHDSLRRPWGPHPIHATTANWPATAVTTVTATGTLPLSWGGVPYGSPAGGCPPPPPPGTVPAPFLPDGVRVIPPFTTAPTPEVRQTVAVSGVTARAGQDNSDITQAGMTGCGGPCYLTHVVDQAESGNAGGRGGPSTRTVPAPPADDPTQTAAVDPRQDGSIPRRVVEEGDLSAGASSSGTPLPLLAGPAGKKAPLPGELRDPRIFPTPQEALDFRAVSRGPAGQIPPVRPTQKVNASSETATPEPPPPGTTPPPPATDPDGPGAAEPLRRSSRRRCQPSPASRKPHLTSRRPGPASRRPRPASKKPRSASRRRPCTPPAGPSGLCRFGMVKPCKVLVVKMRTPSPSSPPPSPPPWVPPVEPPPAADPKTGGGVKPTAGGGASERMVAASRAPPAACRPTETLQSPRRILAAPSLGQTPVAPVPPRAAVPLRTKRCPPPAAAEAAALDSPTIGPSVPLLEISDEEDDNNHSRVQPSAPSPTSSEADRRILWQTLNQMELRIQHLESQNEQVTLTKTE